MVVPLGAVQYALSLFGNVGTTSTQTGMANAYNALARSGRRYGGGGTSGGNVLNAPFVQGTNPLPIIRGRRRGVLPIGGGVATASVASGGINYNTGDIVTLVSAQNGGVKATFRVTSVTAGALTGVQVLDPGSSALLPNNPNSVAATTGTGAGATINIVLQTGWLGPAPNASN